MGADVFCQECGAAIDAEARFCSDCGARQEMVPQAAPPEPQRPPPELSQRVPAPPTASPAPVPDDRAQEVTEAHFGSAMVDLERISRGYFTHKVAMPLFKSVLDSLHPGERVDLLAPIVVEVGAVAAPQLGTPVKPTGKLRVGYAVTTESRVLLHWIGGGRFSPQHEHVAIAYAAVEAVNDHVLNKAFEHHEGFEILAGGRWPITFTNNPDAPDMSFWRSRLRRRVAGESEPLWHGEQVRRWPAREKAQAEGFATPGQANPKRYDLEPIASHLAAGESVLAAVGGGRLNESAEIGGTFYLTDRRSLFVAYGADAEAPPDELPRATAVTIISTDDSPQLGVSITCAGPRSWLWTADAASQEEIDCAHRAVSAGAMSEPA